MIAIIGRLATALRDYAIPRWHFTQTLWTNTAGLRRRRSGSDAGFGWYSTIHEAALQSGLFRQLQICKYGCHAPDRPDAVHCVDIAVSCFCVNDWPISAAETNNL
jgi:hypothetical protein